MNTQECLVYINDSNIKNAGKGIFAKNKIKKNTLIEYCPFIEISQNDPAFNSPTLIQYLFFFGKNKKKAALALGYGSFYNHSNKPNAKFTIKPKEKIIRFEAIKEIKKGDEITFNYYGKNPKNKRRPLWFEI
jgi:SET domain-containing protein